jgi:hypothetical protein
VVSSSPKTLTFDTLYGVSCTPGHDCWVVGFSQNTVAPQTTRIEHWDKGYWAPVPSPNVNGAALNKLMAVACVSASDCWAVGNSSLDLSDVQNTQTLIEHWDGSSWTLVSSPNPGIANGLNGVTCVSSSECWAVGFYSNADYNKIPLVERWNGTTWTTPSPPVGAPPNTIDSLNGVACTDANNCWAVGSSLDPSTSKYFSLIERWDGNTWTRVASATPPGATVTLRGVACATVSECWAVGDDGAHNLIERWDGNAWTIVPSENTGQLHITFPLLRSGLLGKWQHFD